MGQLVSRHPHGRHGAMVSHFAQALASQLVDDLHRWFLRRGDGYRGGMGLGIHSRPRLAHRLGLELFVGAITEGWVAGMLAAA